jgi:hypothetical protein
MNTATEKVILDARQGKMNGTKSWQSNKKHKGGKGKGKGKGDGGAGGVRGGKKNTGVCYEF